ncbi:MAG: hypothetical protein JNK66_06670 [Chitinophagales bacterium]|nr:hypothetical protein [Chitinophagales bacterium]
MELIMAILYALGLISTGNEKISNWGKIESTKKYQKVYTKTGTHLYNNPQAWSAIVLGK